MKKNKLYSTHETSGIKVWLKYIVITIIIVVFIGLIWRATLDSDNLKSGDMPPIIYPSEGAIKVRPSGTSGMEVKHQDKQVFDLLTVQNVNKKIPMEITKQQKSAVNAEKIKQKELKELADIISSYEVKEATLVKKEIVPKPSTTTKVKTISKGAWGVQLASFKSEMDAQNAIDKFKLNFTKQLENLVPDIQKADLGFNKGGIFYRVRFLGLTSKNNAKDLCRKLKELNQGCLHVKH